jgi:hypothetical protein
MQVTWLDKDGMRHVIDVQDDLAIPVGRVLAADHDAAGVRVAGVPVAGEATRADRAAFGRWQKGEHLTGSGPQEPAR